MPQSFSRGTSRSSIKLPLFAARIDLHRAQIVGYNPPMPQTPQSQWPMVSGWLVPFLWPLAAGAILTVLMRETSELDLLDFTVWGSLGLIAIAVLFKPAQFLLIQLPHSFRQRPRIVYACPACGHDIHLTPHHCPNCGTPLVWGELRALGRDAVGRRVRHG